MYVTNTLNIQTPAFKDILVQESRLRDLLEHVEIGTCYWNHLWDRLDRVLAAKRKYESKVATALYSRRRFL